MALRPKGAIAALAIGQPSLAAARAWLALVLADLAGWVWLARSHASILSPGSCGSSLGWVSSGWSGAEAALLLNPPARLVMLWLVMVWAMMTPLLAEPITHLWTCGSARLRPPFIALFVASYAAVWLVAGVLLMGAAVALKGLAGAAALPTPALAAAIALLWQASPLKQSCLNGCHRLPRLRPSGCAAALGCLRYGVVTAVWCVGACWALMLAPLVVDRMHFALMAAVATVLFLERQAPTRPARGRWIPFWRFRNAAEDVRAPCRRGSGHVAPAGRVARTREPSFVSRL